MLLLYLEVPSKSLLKNTHTHKPTVILKTADLADTFHEAGLSQVNSAATSSEITVGILLLGCRLSAPSGGGAISWLGGVW